MKKISRKPKTTALIVAGMVAVLALGGVAYAWQRPDKPKEVAVVEKTSSQTYGPPTEEEKAEADAHKDDLVERINEEKKNEPEDPSKKDVTPIVTSASQSGDTVQVMGYVPGIFEDNGTCTAVFTRGTATVTKTSKGFANVSTTDCAPLSVPRSEFPSAGEWQVVLKYISTTAVGSAAPKAVTVQ